MTDTTLPTPAPFDEHDIEIIAQQQIDAVLKRAGTHINMLIAFGRKLCHSRASINHGQRLCLYLVMMELRLQGVVNLPARVMSHHIGRVLAYEAICRTLYSEVSR